MEPTLPRPASSFWATTPRPRRFQQPETGRRRRSWPGPRGPQVARDSCCSLSSRVEPDPPPTLSLHASLPLDRSEGRASQRLALLPTLSSSLPALSISPSTSFPAAISKRSSWGAGCFKTPEILLLDEPTRGIDVGRTSRDLPAHRSARAAGQGHRARLQRHRGADEPVRPHRRAVRGPPGRHLRARTSFRTKPCWPPPSKATNSSISTARPETRLDDEPFARPPPLPRAAAPPLVRPGRLPGHAAGARRSWSVSSAL